MFEEDGFRGVDFDFEMPLGAFLTERNEVEQKYKKIEQLKTLGIHTFKRGGVNIYMGKRDRYM